MFKPTKLLKVVSVLLIVFAIISLVIQGIGYAMLPTLQGVMGSDSSLLDGAFSPLTLVIGLVGCVLSLIAGICGMKGKNYKMAMISMVAYIVLTAISAAITAASTGFSSSVILNFLIPVLYLWGLYQSKEA